MTTQTNDDVTARALAAARFNTEAEAEGKRPLIPADKYPACRVEVLEMLESKYTWDNGDAKFQAKVKFICADSDVDLTSYITISKGTGGTYYSLMQAVFGEPKNMVGKTILDCNGAVVDLMVTHAISNATKKPYAKLTFYPPKAPKK